MADAKRVFCDTNVLLSAVDVKRTLHAQALHVLNVLPNDGTELCLSGQIIREFLAVCTRPIDVNGLGLPTRLAVRNAEAIVERSTILEETRGVAGRLRSLALKTKCAGRQMHDANVVATMQEHGLTRLITANPTDFARFSEVELVDLTGVQTTVL